MATAQKAQTWIESYKDMYDTSLDQKFAHIIQCVNAPKNTLFEIIENIRQQYPAIDPELVQIIIQGELGRHITSPTCSDCGSRGHKKMTIKKNALPLLMAS